MKLVKLIYTQYSGDRKAAAKAANTTLQTIKNWIQQDREVIALADGNWVLKSDKTIIFGVLEQRLKEGEK